MFREPKRKNRTLPEEHIEEILNEGLYGVLATTGVDGYPYATPLSYIYHNGKIYFHCAPSGMKMENISNCDKVSFTVVTDVETLPNQFSTKYRSVVLFGRAKVIEGSEKDAALEEIIEKYAPDFIDQGQLYIKGKKEITSIIGIEIEYQTAKGRLE
ncbi:pyridoxamine 5'-phosphate oxidase family protein [Proteiniclasticum sp. SCR006]|uniref:Pyridoxamine 5'-phosphate oxidase family protein n=1 Tax=Proteiniclasticum aestuarii TaxID=2817862 RepID=A0A939KI59_9CLOT|nr:pyridoxamine 5'-phosphate oxidase family protein [Proteiniclasticum aestuarii]MBO1266294.1 pyridoxamine 5'-phosphate oxidase family protein [Proteiniclasticum aestuarii]